MPAKSVDEHRPTGARRRWLSAASVSLLTLVVLLAGAEALLRVLRLPFSSAWTPSENSLAQFDPELGWSYVPGRSHSRTFGEPAREVSIHFDSLGARSASPDAAPDFDLPTVIFVGGSYTMGHGLPFEETFVGRLDGDLDFPFQVVNLGVQAYGTDQSLLQLRRHIGRFRCVAVVYTFIDAHVKRNANYDRRLIVPSARFLGTKPLFGLGDDGSLILRKRPARYEEMVEVNLWNGLRLAWHRLGPTPGPALTRALVREMASVAQANDAKLVVLVWRQRDVLGNEATMDWEDSAASAWPTNLTFVDTLTDRPPAWDEWIIPGDGHPDARAHAHVAAILKAEFTRLRLLPAD